MLVYGQWESTSVFQSQLCCREFAFFLALVSYSWMIQKNYLFKLNTVFLFPLFMLGLGSERLFDSIVMRSGSKRTKEGEKKEKMLFDHL